MLGFYRATLAPSLIHPPGDSQELTVVVSLGLTHPTGYPLYTWVGWLFTRLWPFGEIAHRTKLLSAVLGAGGVGMLYLVARTLGLARPAAVVGVAPPRRFHAVLVAGRTDQGLRPATSSR